MSVFKNVKEINTRLIGTLYENKAVRFLKKSGYKIQNRNYKNQIGEIDIIASKDNFIIFAEVKYRKNTAFGTPAMAVDFKKQNKYRIIAQYYISANKLNDKSIRFDVIEILGDKINHIINAF